MLNGINIATLFFANSFTWTNGFYDIVNWRFIHYLFSIYVPLKLLFRCVWFFDFGFLNMTVVKNCMKKYPFMMYFQNAYTVLVLHNFFCSGNPISHILEANNSWLSWTRGNCYIGKMPVLEQSIWFFKLFLTWFTFKHFQRVTVHYFNYL